jgi:hypothetical protein
MNKPVIALASITVSALLAVTGAAPVAAVRVPASARTLTWSVVRSPNRGTIGSGLSAVSCASAQRCTAVGAYAGSTGLGRTLAESWNGSRWSVVPSPNRGSGSNALFGASCAAAAACMAVGASGLANGAATGLSVGQQRTLTESWDGTRWSVLPSPSPGSTGSALFGVSCAAADACAAVGATGNSGDVERPLVESWDGAQWTVVPSPSLGSAGTLFAVSCTANNACMAVGCFGKGNNCFRTLAESWDGARWTMVPSPSPGTFANRLNGVSCAAADACTAVGVTGNKNSGVTATLIESWNGSRWSVVPSLDPGPSYTWFSGVSCASTDACTATGTYLTSTQANRTLIESWDGTHWSVVPHPQPGIPGRDLPGVSCASAATCTVAGSYSAHGAVRTLIETGTASG